MARTAEQVLKAIIGDYVAQIAVLTADVERLSEIIQAAVKSAEQDESGPTAAPSVPGSTPEHAPGDTI